VLFYLEDLYYDTFDITQNALRARNVVNDNNYNYFIHSCVIIGAIVELNGLRIKDRDYVWDLYFNVALQLLFTFDIVARVIANYPDYNKYFDNKWNRFDLFITVVVWIPLMGSFEGLYGRLLGRWSHLYEVFISPIPDLYTKCMTVQSCFGSFEFSEF
jgi:hypothetical protein